MQANNFILNCPMRPIRRHGVDTDKFIVYTENGSPIGTYHPTRVVFEPIDNWPTTFSRNLIELIFHGGDHNA